jgi:transmembrane sensor
MMKEEEFRELLTRYGNGEATEQERAMLESRYLHWNEKDKPLHTDELLNEVDTEMWAVLKDRLELGEANLSSWRGLWLRVAAAAAVLLVIGAGLFYIGQKKVEYEVLTAKRDIGPGKQGATLTLANGTRIKLNSTGNGELAKEAGIAIRKSADGQLIYELLTQNHDAGGVGNRINTLSTAKGETYRLSLPDGSLVWLNAASSLTYAANLSGGQGKRKVKLDGEAYFEIAKDKSHPFVVESRGQEIEVLGTHFNVNTYAYEAGVRTTLLEGSVQITPLQDPAKKVVLKPGEQALATKQFLKILPVDVEAATAWKNGNFFFKEEKLESILYKLAYWYDIEIVYVGKKPKMVMTGIIKRDTKLSTVLRLIEISGKVSFRIEGRKVFVME